MSYLLHDFIAHLAKTKGEVAVLEMGTIKSNDGENFSCIATIYNGNHIPRTEIERALSEYLDDIGAYDGCGHSHDCCGCEFLNWVTIVNEHPDDEKSTFLIYKESYGINL